MTHPTVPVLVVVVVAAAAAAAVLTTTTLSLKNNSTSRWVSKHVSESYEFYCCRYKCLPRVCHSPTFAAVDRASRQALSMFSSAANRRFENLSITTTSRCMSVEQIRHYMKSKDDELKLKTYSNSRDDSCRRCWRLSSVFCKECKNACCCCCCHSAVPGKIENNKNISGQYAN